MAKLVSFIFRKMLQKPAIEITGIRGIGRKYAEKLEKVDCFTVSVLK